MLKQTVNYTNADGASVSKDVYFNITSNDLLSKEAASGDKYSKKLQNISKSEKMSEVYPVVIEFMELGYGIRTEDGDFLKSEDGADFAYFRRTLAFQALMEDLLMEPSNNGNKLADFIIGMLPPEMARQAQEQAAQAGFRPGSDTSRPTPPVAGSPAAGTPANAIHATPPEVAQGYIQQTSEPRTPDLPGQPYQQ